LRAGSPENSSDVRPRSSRLQASREWLSDNGPEFAGQALDVWAHERRVALDFITPGRPFENAFIESFIPDSPHPRLMVQRSAPPIADIEECMTRDRKSRSDKMHEQRMMSAPLPPNFLNPGLEWRRRFAEVWGTFLLVAVAAGSGVVSARTGGVVTPGMMAVAPGLMVIAIIYFMGTVSGAHLNPAVTLAFAVRGNFPWRRVPGYVLAQVVGAVLAVLFLRAMFGTVGSLGATIPGSGIGVGKALAMEVMLTAGLVNTILGTASGARNVGTNGALAVGGYVILAGLWAAPVSGASMNPVRSLGPDLVRGDFSTTWVYIVGPVVGALIGVAFEWLLKGDATAAGALAAQGTLAIEDSAPPRST
jgi:aquaporin Z